MIYINGVHGTVGNYIYNFLVKKYEVGALSSTAQKNEIFCDLTQKQIPNINFKNNDFFIFLASCSNFNFANKYPEITKKVNIDGTVFLLDHLLDSGVKILFFSSAAVYGDVREPATEDKLQVKDTIYSQTKIYIEEKYKNNDNIKFLRPSFIITSNDPLKKYFNTCSLSKQEAEIFSGNLISPIAALDVCNILLFIMKNFETTPKFLNLGSSQPKFKEDLALLYKQNVDPDFCYKIVPPPPEFAKGRSMSIPLNIDRLKSFWGEPEDLASVLKREYQIEKP